MDDNRPEIDTGDDRVRYRARRRRLSSRADFAADRIASPAITPARQAPKHHHERMADYRDRILALARGRIGEDVFSELETCSLHARDTMPANTEIARYADFLRYLEHCADFGLCPLPVTDETLQCYLDGMGQQGLRQGTISRRLSSLVTWCRWLNLDNPTRSRAAEFAIKRALRRAAAPQRQAGGLRVEHLHRAQKVLQPALLRDSCDIALLFTAFYTLSRRSEVVAFDWEGLEVDRSDGSGLLYLPHSKTDQAGEGHYLYISRATVELLMHWRALSGCDSGAIFRGVYSDGTLGERLSTRGVDRAFKRIARLAGFDAALFSGHSTRVGAAQEMLSRGSDSAMIMLAGRWKSERMVARYGRKIHAKSGAAAALAQAIEQHERRLVLDWKSRGTLEKDV